MRPRPLLARLAAGAVAAACLAACGSAGDRGSGPLPTPLGASPRASASPSPVTSSAGPSYAPLPSAALPGVDACALLTPEEVAGLFGYPLAFAPQPAGGVGADQCEYDPQAPSGDVVRVTLRSRTVSTFDGPLRSAPGEAGLAEHVLDEPFEGGRGHTVTLLRPDGRVLQVGLDDNALVAPAPLPGLGRALLALALPRLPG